MPSVKPNRSIFVFAALIAVAGCNRSEVNVSGPFPQRGYLWQREWTPAVIDSLGEAARRMDGVVVLGAEINLAGKKPEIVKVSIDWEAVKRQTEHCSVALRVSPFGGPFRADDGPARTIVDVTKELLDNARAHDVKVEEFQFDANVEKHVTRCASRLTNIVTTFASSTSFTTEMSFVDPQGARHTTKVNARRIADCVGK